MQKSNKKNRALRVARQKIKNDHSCAEEWKGKKSRSIGKAGEHMQVDKGTDKWMGKQMLPNALLAAMWSTRNCIFLGNEI